VILGQPGLLLIGLEVQEGSTVVSDIFPDHAELEQACKVFRLLSDPTRLQILSILSRGEKHVGALCKILGLPQPTVSHHLGLLRVAGVARGRREGKLVFYQLNPESVQLEADRSALKMSRGSARILLEDMVSSRPVSAETPSPAFLPGDSGHETSNGLTKGDSPVGVPT